ncbi:hypothetical protein NQ318_005571 [Aromia moschata]|uniref:DUF4789 domain-containing protein n=1 Tax=Aromia moschata TaxID=1265417 RepID=A0AAV8XIA3_9CUCU|nr:hypothetical protein NQ318_005571 [Aromia moschata]
MISPTIWLIHVDIFLFLLQPRTQGAVMAPPWANPKLNPCASQPRGWQLLFWPPDGKCYKIFQVGHPCPEGMELSPVSSKSGKQLSAECRCPPQTAQSATDGKCYELFSLGPCEKGYYFGPDTQYKSDNSKREWGVCQQLKPCASPSWIYWPKTGRCYQTLTRGPCPKGQLLTVDENSEIPVCKCGDHEELREYRGCYKRPIRMDTVFYQRQRIVKGKRGPCLEKGHLLVCPTNGGCHGFLRRHFHEDVVMQCFELETIGPCGQGQLYRLHPEAGRALCRCKPNYVRYRNSSSCYRPYTRGPCDVGHMLVNATACAEQPCERGHLYFPERRRCYRVGSRGPCAEGRVVAFDLEARPSVDGVSYNGVCACPRGAECREAGAAAAVAATPARCDRSKGLVRYGRECHKMYTQGPCPRGSWLAPAREPRTEGLFGGGGGEREARCECIPGYARSVRTDEGEDVTVCVSRSAVRADRSAKDRAGNSTATAQVIRVADSLLLRFIRDCKLANSVSALRSWLWASERALSV